MKEGWKETTLGNFVDCNPKIYIKKGQVVENCEMEDINPDYKFLYPREGKLYNGSNSKFQNGDTVFARITPCLENGKIAQIKDLKTEAAIGSTEFFVFREKSQISDNEFIYYLSKSNLVRDTAVNSMTGASGRQRADLKALKKLKIKVPSSVKHQQRIASILSAYDDLIEVNNKRIELLEQSARELYKEWFVRMRFPNYQNTKFNKGFPEGWEAKKIGEIVDRKKFGKTYKEVELEKIGNVIVIDQSAHPFLGFHNNKADHLATEENPIILFGDHSCKMEIMIKPFSLAENVIPFKALDNDMSIYYLYHLVNNLVVTTEYKRHWGELTSKLVLIPNNKDISNLFHEFCTSIYSQINYLKEYNLQLTEIRNRLLPRLISGKLEVKE